MGSVRAVDNLFKKDAVEFLKSIDDNKIDLVVTDLPYESLEKHRKTGTTTRLKDSKSSSNKWFDIFPNDRFGELFDQLYRVLKPNTHLYMFCDHETSFIMKPAGEKAGFKFWKPIIWDKCLGPNTTVCTTSGVIKIKDIKVGDCVFTPTGEISKVRAVRKTKANAKLLKLSDGTELIASLNHKFIVNGDEVEVKNLKNGDSLDFCDVKLCSNDKLYFKNIIPKHDLIYELPNNNICLWCGKEFNSYRAASAHQSRFCSEKKYSKKDMSKLLKIKTKKISWWFAKNRIPHEWAEKLGIKNLLQNRVQYLYQNNTDMWFPESINIDYELGKFVGLYAAEGSYTKNGISFAFHINEKHLHHHIERIARFMGVKATKYTYNNCCVIQINYKIAKYLIQYFIGGRRSTTKYFKETLYCSSDEFINGVLRGLIEGDGCWESEVQRESFVSTSIHLSLFVQRKLFKIGSGSRIRRFENDFSGGWNVSHDPRPINYKNKIIINKIEDVGIVDLIDISIEHPSELFILGNGVVSHNCKIGMGYHYRARYEMIMFFEKGKRKLNNLSIPDIIQVPRVYRGYPTEKPMEVSEILIKQSTNEGDVVIDPFVGSGSTGVAALKNKRNFYGADISEEALELAASRICKYLPLKE